MSETDEAIHPGHGHSPAAWTAVVIILVAFTVGTLAFWFAAQGADLQWLVWASAGLAVVGVIVGGILSKAGYGANGPKFASKSH